MRNSQTGDSEAGSRGDQPHLATLRTWAEARGLVVSASGGTQREPEFVVAVADGEGGTTLLRRQSLDSIDTAALYLIDTIDRLRLDE